LLTGHFAKKKTFFSIESHEMRINKKIGLIWYVQAQTIHLINTIKKRLSPLSRPVNRKALMHCKFFSVLKLAKD